MASLIPTLGLGRPGGALATLGSGRITPFAPRVPSRPIGLAGADPSLRVLSGADPRQRTLTGADPSMRTLEGADPSDLILGG